MIKYLLIILIVTQMDKCNQQDSVKSKSDLKIYYGTSQSWSGGAMGSGRGTNYRFYISRADSTIAFDSVWVNGYRLALKKEMTSVQKIHWYLMLQHFFLEASQMRLKESLKKRSC